MSLPFKYITSFASDISVQEVKEDFISSASDLEDLKSLIPKDIDFKKNIDIIGVAFNAAVANLFNKNGDGINGPTAVAIKDHFMHKPTNIEHQRDKVVGHIVGSSLSSYEDSQITESSELLASNQPFNIALSAVVYKSVNPDFANLIEKSTDESSEFHHKVSASWELGFNEYDVAVGSENLSEAKIITDAGEKEELTKCLKCYGGSGKTEDGENVYRLIKGDIYPLGIGFTANPAASVEGIVMANNDIPEDLIASEDDFQFKKIEIKTEQKISQTEKGNVQSYNIHNKQIMEQEILDQFKNILEESKSSKKLSEEAVANMTKIFHDAIVERSEKWQSEKDQLVGQKEELEKVAESTAQEVEAMKQQLKETAEELDSIKSEVEAKKALDLFNDRMNELDELFSLEDEDRTLLADELKSLDSEEAYASYKEKMSVLWKHKNKAHIEEIEKALQEKIEAGVQERLASLQSEASQETSSEEEIVEEAIENAEVEDEALANNNGSSTQEEKTLREKFLQAFSEDSVTIQY